MAVYAAAEKVYILKTIYTFYSPIFITSSQWEI